MKFSLQLNADFLKKSCARRIFYDLWKLGLAYVAILVFVISRWGEPDFNGWAVFFLTLVGLATMIFAVAWFQQAKRIDDWIQSQGAAPVIYTLSDETVETTAETGSTKLKWDAFAELSIADSDILLKLPRRSGALTLDTQQVPREAIEYLKNRFQAHGKKIEDKRKNAQP
jgi:hypothetical protein